MTHLGELSSAYLDGEVSPAESEQVRRHLSSCESCRRKLADLHQARSAVRALPTLEVPAVVFAELGLEPLGTVVSLRRRVVTWLAAAAVAAAVFVAAGAALTPDPVGLPLTEVAELHVQHDPLTPVLTPTGGAIIADASR